jgi:hypothetical protein
MMSASSSLWQFYRGTGGLDLPAVLPDQTVNAVRASNFRQATPSPVVALIVAHADGRRGGGERENAEDLGELHGDNF